MTIGDGFLIESLNKELSMDLTEQDNGSALREKLYRFIDHLIETNFEKLIFILYRIDVPENKLKQLLEKFPMKDAGFIIGNLIINRQLQKIKTRQEWVMPVHEISEDERW